MVHTLHYILQTSIDSNCRNVYINNTLWEADLFAHQQFTALRNQRLFYELWEALEVRNITAYYIVLQKKYQNEHGNQKI